jgi:hypothetical protein
MRALRSPTFRCLALTGFISLVCPVVWASLEGDEFAANFEREQVVADTLPSTCETPFRETGVYFQFFTSAISIVAAQKGPDASGVPELFAVAELRNKMQEIFPNLGEESPIDRLVVAQLCQYRAIKEKKSPPKQAFTTVQIETSDEELQAHLQGIATRLYSDARMLMVQALAARARLDNQEELLEGKWDRVRRARQLGNSKVADLFRD